MVEFIDNNTIPNSIKSYLRAKGVPFTFFSQPRFKLEEHILRFSYSDDKQKGSVISPDIQYKAFMRTYKKPLERPYLYVIATDHNEIRAGAVALTIFERLSNKLILDKTHSVSGSPYWHQVYGGRWDKLRDDKGTQTTVGDISFLVISNIADNSTHEKIEKVRDLNYRYIDVPRIMVVAGTNPLKFSYDQLKIRPDRMLYLGERKYSV